jgi:phosphopantetheine adenylyltransferase
MKDVYLFAGSFDPPTLGHLEVVNEFFRQRKKENVKARLIILCSLNPEKKLSRWFNEIESKRLWKKYYKLSSSTRVLTNDELANNRHLRNRIIHLIRGLREGQDQLEEFKLSLLENDRERRALIIKEATHVFTNPEFSHISSSRLRALICQGNMKEAKEFVPSAMIPVLGRRFNQISTQLEMKF